MSASPPRATKVVMQPVPSIKDRLKQLQPSHVRATTCAYSMPCGNDMLLSLIFMSSSQTATYTNMSQHEEDIVYIYPCIK